MGFLELAASRCALYRPQTNILMDVTCSVSCLCEQRSRHRRVLRHVAREEAEDKETLFGVVLLSAADSSRRSPAACRRAHSHDAVDAVPALPGEHGAPARSQMGFDLEPRYVCILGGTFPNRGCDNHLLGFGRLQILSLRLHGRMSSRLARSSLDPVGGDAAGAVIIRPTAG